MAKKQQSEAESRLDTVFAALQLDLQDPANLERDEKIRFALERQLQRMKKRALYHKPELKKQAIQEFVALNESLASKTVNVCPQILADARHFIRCVLENYATRVNETNIQVCLDLDHLYDLWQFSPGATQHEENLFAAGDGKHAAQKISAPFTTTWRAVPWVYKLRRTNHYFHQHDTIAGKVGMTPVQGSILATVPKNQEKVRTIAKEPLGNMLMQLAAGYYLAGVLASIGLRIDTQQPKNKALALIGSLSGKLATLDMKSASDMILPMLVRALFPEEWYEMLMDLRSEYCTVPGYGTVKLNMISTMGNGFTFPLMTLILVALIYGMRAQKPKCRPLYIDWTTTAVYGDDIIVPVEEAAELIGVLTDAGFVVNNDKSYVEGPFRESCGGDYWNGYDVTPFYISSLATNPEIYVSVNKTLEFCAKHKVVLCETLRALKDMIRGPVFCVAEWDAPDSGIQTCNVPRRYKKLQVKPQVRELESREYLLPLAIAGYVESSDLVSSRELPWTQGVGEDLLSMFWHYRRSTPKDKGVTSVTYCPQPYKNEYRAKSCRLPRGFLTGWDPIKRSHEASSFISAYVELIFS